MLDGYHILTITHRQTPLKKIGDYVFHLEGDALKDSLNDLRMKFGLSEILYLSTCNRVTFLIHTRRLINSDFVNQFFRFINPSLSESDIAAEAIHFQGIEALEHLFKVGASIDSMVVGEGEILRQLRTAYDKCLEWGLTGDHLRLAMDAAVVAAKEVYARTRIGEKPVSVVSLAIGQLLKDELPKTARILIVGAGQTNSLVAKFLLKYQYNNVAVFNRTLFKAREVAEKLGGSAFLLSDLEDYDKGFDCLIVCTGATKPIIGADLYDKLLRGEDGKKVVVDLGVPNDVAGEVVENFELEYIEIENLRNLAKANLAFREREVAKAKTLLSEYLQEFKLTYRQRQIERAMQSVPSEIKAIKEKAMTQVFKKEIEALDDPSRQLLEKMMVYMEKKCIGIPMKAARRVAI